MKDIFNFIFTFRNPEKVLDKTDNQKRKFIFTFMFIFVVCYLFFIVWSFILSIKSLYGKFIDTSSIVFIDGIIMMVFATFIATLIISVALWLSKLVVFKIFRLDKNFLDSVYLWIIPFTVIIFKFFIDFIFVLIALYTTSKITNYLEYLNYMIFIWYLLLDFLLMKKLTNNTKTAIISVIISILILIAFIILLPASK